MSELTNIKTSQEIVLHHLIQVNREAKSVHLSNSIYSMKEALAETDKAIEKIVRKGDFRD